MKKKEELHVKSECDDGKNHLKTMATAKLPTKYGHFTIVAFCNTFDDKEHIAIVKGKVSGKENVPTRLHSECLTGDALGSLKCDCGTQLEAALEFISKQPAGIILYLRQEGRGIGLVNKIRAYHLQDQGLDTVEANRALGLPDDARDYAVAALMLEALEIKSVSLLTNNPHKVSDLEEHGTKVSKRLQHEFKANPHNKGYLEVKKKKFRHYLKVEG